MLLSDVFSALLIKLKYKLIFIYRWQGGGGLCQKFKKVAVLHC
jgi:hypothetical protein